MERRAVVRRIARCRGPPHRRSLRPLLPSCRNRRLVRGFAPQRGEGRASSYRSATPSHPVTTLSSEPLPLVFKVLVVALLAAACGGASTPAPDPLAGVYRIGGGD